MSVKPAQSEFRTSAPRPQGGGISTSTGAPARSRRWPLSLVIMLVLGFVAYRWGPGWMRSVTGSASAIKKPTVRSVSVLTAKSRRGDLPVYLDGLGTVTAFKVVTIHSRVDGLLVKVNFTEGQIVHEGDVIAEIDVRPFQADLDNKLAVEMQASAAIDLAMVTFNHIKSMPEDAATLIEVQTAEANVKQAKASLDAAKAMVNTARLNVEWCRITAPISGRIGLRQVDQGNLIHQNDPNGLAVITQFQPISVIFSLPQDSLPQVLEAKKAAKALPAEAYSSDFKTLIAKGELLAVDNQIDAATGTARFKAVFENQDDALFPNQFVNIRLLVATRKDAVLVNTAAVQRSPAATFVYVVKSDETVEMRQVTIGHSERNTTVIESGLAPGETVVTDGVEKLQPGSRVSPQKRERTTTSKKS